VTGSPLWNDVLAQENSYVSPSSTPSKRLGTAEDVKFSFERYKGAARPR